MLEGNGKGQHRQPTTMGTPRGGMKSHRGGHADQDSWVDAWCSVALIARRVAVKWARRTAIPGGPESSGTLKGTEGPIQLEGRKRGAPSCVAKAQQAWGRRKGRVRGRDGVFGRCSLAFFKVVL